MPKILTIYFDCAKTAYKQQIKNWRIIPGLFGLGLVILVASQIAPAFGIVGGFLMAILLSYLTSIYYNWLKTALNQGRLDWKGLLENNIPGFLAVIQTGFIIWVATFPIDIISRNPNSAGLAITLNYALAAVIILVLNPLAEFIYEEGDSGIDAIVNAGRFTQSLWLEWLPPWLLISALPFIFAPSWALDLLPLNELVLTSPFIPAATVLHTLLFASPLPFFVTIIIGTVLMSWLMLFRGNLFRALQNGKHRRI
jgi:hypothetical protein